MNTRRNVPFFAWTLAISLFAINAHGADRMPQDAAVTSHIPRESVRSSGLAAVGYSKRKQILEIQFINGAVYRYFNVPQSVYRDLVSSESKTWYYDSYIKRNYRSIRVRPRVKEQTAN
jgi:hypothetical protein